MSPNKKFDCEVFLCDYVDNKNIEGIKSCFADDAVIYVNGHPPVNGKEGVQMCCDGIMKMAKKVRHFDLRIIPGAKSNELVCHGNGEYDVEGTGKDIIFRRFCDVYTLTEDGSKIQELYTFMDVTAFGGLKIQ